MKKRFLFIGLFFIIIVGLTLFYKYNYKSNKSNKITVAEVTHSVFYAPFYVSLHNNYFKDEGLDVDVILTSGADKVASAVISGDANIGLSGLEATLYVYKNDAKDYLVSFSSLTKRDGQFLFGPCEYKSNFDLSLLKGKSVLAGRKGGMPSMVFEYALYKNGLSKDDVIIDNSVDFASLSSAYIARQGDFVNLFEPNATLLEKEGYGCVLDSIGLLSGEVPYTVFHSKKSYIDNNKDTIKKFTNAILKGLTFVKENDSKTIANIIKEEFPDTKLLDLEVIIDRYKKADTWYTKTCINKEAYDNLISLMKYSNQLDREYDFNTLVSVEYCE